MSRDPIPYPTVSFSRLETWQKCQKKYEFKYVHKDRPPEPFSESLEKGKIVHAGLEEILDPSTLTETGDDALALTIPTLVEELQLPFELEELFEFGNQMGALLYRASARCASSDAIRNKDGSIPKDLQNYPPAGWTKAMKDAGLYSKRLEFDNRAARACNGFIGTSFSYFIGDVFSMVRYFQPPSWHEKTLYVELPVSTTEENKVMMPGTDVAINAYIDWVFRTTDGRVVIADHKTSVKKPLIENVLHHPQLNLYAALWRQLMGSWPDILAIHHVASGELIMAEVDVEIVNQTLDHQRSMVQATDSEFFVKRHPGEYNTPCIKRDWKTGVITEMCPFLAQCWPTYAEVIHNVSGQQVN